jgi:undecaprenyl-diphosphatase
MLESLITLDKELVVAINSANTNWLDHVMIFISGKLSWIPLYAAILYGVIKKQNWQTAAVLIGAILLNFGLTDQISLIFKFGFERLRPCHDPEIGDLLHMVVGCGGQFGFVSSHASNTMGLAIITALVFRTNWVTIGMLTFALLNSYSRIYLGKHYLGDVLGGITLGIACALISYGLAQLIIQKAKLKR